MVDWLKKLRGIAGLTIFGGLAGALFGVVTFVISSLFGFGTLSLAAVASGTVPWAMLGAFCAGGVGIAIATVESKKSLAELSALRAAVCGGVLGASSLLAVLVLFSPGPQLATLIVGASFGALLGAGTGGGLIAAGKRADRETLSAPTSLPGDD